jgi:hypothetical protein
MEVMVRCFAGLRRDTMLLLREPQQGSKLEKLEHMLDRIAAFEAELDRIEASLLQPMELH